MTDQARCGARNCGAPIMWTTTAAGVSQPVDQEPDPKGVVVVKTVGSSHRSRVVMDLDAPIGKDEARHTPHHQTCPSSAQFRSRASGQPVVRDKPLPPTMF
jgi:hypothetical protein